MKVIKKVEEFDAVQWRPGKTVEGVEVEYFTHPYMSVERGVGGVAGLAINYGRGVDCLRAFLVTKDARQRVYNGDWIITDSTGKKSVCPKAEFDKRYEVPHDWRVMKVTLDTKIWDKALQDFIAGKSPYRL